MAKRVLLLDDDEQFRKLVRPALEAKGLVVAEAAKTTIAERTLATFRPHLMVVDGLLPDRSGIEWITDLRSHGIELPIVFVSAFWRDLASYRRLTNELGVKLVLYKPVDPARFASHVATLVGEVQSTRPPPRHEPRISSRPAPDPATIDAAVDENARPDLEQAHSDSATDGRTPSNLDATYSIPAPLRQAYAATLPTIIGQLADAAANVLEGDAEAVAMLRARAHELRGTAGSFGYHEVGLLAGEIEDLTEERIHTIAEQQFWDVSKAIRAESSRNARSRLMQRGLLVESDPVVAGQLRDAATWELVELELVASDEDARSHIRHRHPSVVVLGALGETNGARAHNVASVISLARERRAPVILLTDHDDVAARRRAADLGVAAMLGRPVDPDRFAIALRRVVHGSGGHPRRVVVVGDRPEALRDELTRRSFFVEVWSDSAAVAAGLRAEPPEALVALELSGIGTGAELIGAIRTAPLYQDVLCAAVDGRPRGADISLPRLLPESQIADQIADALGRRHARATAHDVDPYTNVLGRSLFVRTLAARLAEASRSRAPLALALIGIDDADRIREQYGTTGLSEAVRSIGHLLHGRFRAHDLRGRLAPDLFAMAFAGASSHTMLPFLETACREFAQLPLATAGTASISIGVASFPEAGTGVPDLLAVADEHLETARARSNGRAVIG